MKNLFIIFVISLLGACCTTRNSDKKVERHLSVKDYAIYYVGENEGRPMFTVIFSNGKAWDSAYAEEIGNFLKTGIIEYDESFIITREYKK